MTRRDSFLQVLLGCIGSVALLGWAGLAVAGPPPAPEGHQWEKVDAFSDEFDGAELDLDKWRTYHPFWATGRRPATFSKDTISVADGMMQIRNRMLDKPRRGYTMIGGAVTSKSEEAHYGYYEVRMKASSVNLSSTFWLTNRSQHGKHQEIDVVEAIGGNPDYADFRHRMKSNSHYFYRGQDLAAGGDAPLKCPADEDFHVFGVWWKDANTLEMYYEDEHVFTIQPSTKFSETPFDRPMFLCMVTEAYNWQPVPSAEDLADDTRNTTYYDWVRGYRLVPKTE